MNPKEDTLQYSKLKLESYEEFLKSNRPVLIEEHHESTSQKNLIWAKIQSSQPKRLNGLVYVWALSCLIGLAIVFWYSDQFQKAEILSESDANLVLDSMQLNVFDEDEDDIIWSAL